MKSRPHDQHAAKFKPKLNRAQNDVQSESEEEYCYACSTHNKLERPKVDIAVNGVPVNMLIDTGSVCP